MAKQEIITDTFVRTPTDGADNPYRNVTGQTVGKKHAVNTYDLNRAEKTAFNEQIIAGKTVLIELKSAVNDVSALRNITTVTGSASVALDNSEYRLRTTALANDSAKLDSAEYGRYVPGYQAECGIGVRLPDLSKYTGEVDTKWGYFSDTDGFFFGRDATGFYVGIRRAGSDTKVYQDSFNSDKVDGTGESEYTIDLTTGNIFEIDYVWYGYGPIRFYIVAKDEDFILGSKKILLHTILTTGQTSVEQPNLPIRVFTDNGATATAHDVFVGGRQYSIYGAYDPIYRITGDFRLSAGLTTTFQPLISFRRKSASIFQNQMVRFESLHFHASADVIVGFVINGTLGGGTSWGNPTQATATETVLESDRTSTTISGGIFTGGFYVAPGGVGANQVDFALENKIQDLINSQPFTVVARARTGTPTMDIISLNLKEEW